MEVLHLGPYFTGEGAFRLEPHDGGTRVDNDWKCFPCSGKPIEAIVRLGWPLMRAAFDVAFAAGDDRSKAARDGHTGPDGQLRCPWSLSAPEYLDYRPRVGSASDHRLGSVRADDA